MTYHITQINEQSVISGPEHTLPFELASPHLGVSVILRLVNMISAVW